MSRDHETAAAQLAYTACLHIIRLTNIKIRLHETAVEPKSEKVDAFGGDLTTRRSKEEEALSDKLNDDSSLEGERPTAEEKATLRHVAEFLPARIWLVAFVELCERFTYYGMQGLFQNYVSHAKDGSDGPKGLGKFALKSVIQYTLIYLQGLGHAGATGLNTYVSPSFLISATLAHTFPKFLPILVLCNSLIRCNRRRPVPRALQNHPDILWSVYGWTLNPDNHIATTICEQGRDRHGRLCYRCHRHWHWYRWDQVQCGAPHCRSV
jgi:hypothetical protein